MLHSIFLKHFRLTQPISTFCTFRFFFRNLSKISYISFACAIRIIFLTLTCLLHYQLLSLILSPFHQSNCTIYYVYSSILSPKIALFYLPKPLFFLLFAINLVRDKSVISAWIVRGKSAISARFSVRSAGDQ